MVIDDTKISMTITLREAQALLLFCREVTAADRLGSRMVSFHGVPRGALTDVENMTVALQEALLMADKGINYK